MFKPHIKLTSNPNARRIGALVTLDVALFSTTDVTKVPSVVVMIGFILLALTIYYLFTGLFSLGRFYGIEVKRQKPLVTYVTLVTAGLLALQSIGQLSQRDVLVLFPLAMLAYLYSAYAKSGRRQAGG